MTRQTHEARSSTGARFARLAAVLLALCLPAAAHAIDELLGEIPWRVGGRMGFTVDTAAFPDSAEGHRLEIYVRIPPTTLDALQRDEAGDRRMDVSVKLRNAFGGGALTWSEEIGMRPEEVSHGFGKVIMVALPTKPGRQRLEVKVEDLKSQKRGIAYFGRVVHESAKVSGEMMVPEPQVDRYLSDIEFIWSEQPDSSATVFRKAGRSVLPNAERLYGRFEDHLNAYFTARAKPEDERAWQWVARVLDREGRAVAEVDSSGAASRRVEGRIRVNLAGLPPGGYDLEVKAWQTGDEGALLRRAKFSVAWEERSWLASTRDLEDNVHFLLDAEAEEAFVLMHPGEQERYLLDFWEQRDPDPERPGNAAREAYLARVAYANATYSRPGIAKGMFSDRGRVFIRYGEPTEIVQQVIPAGDETLRQMIEEIAYYEDRSPEHLRQPGIGGDMRPFEVWIYTGEIPKPPDTDPDVPRNPRRRLVFLFVDEQGLGYYTLRYSTE